MGEKPETPSNTFKKKIDTTRLASGTKVGQYIILNEIDRGGMAIVYRARQLGLDREVALKVLPPSVSIQGKFIDRFQKEAKSIAQLDHPHIVKIIEVGGDSGIYFIAMEYLEGLNLFKYMVKFEPTVYTVVQIIKQVADALEYAHGRNIIHRDLKLNNVIMKDNSYPVLIDFGLAKAREADSGLTISGEILGSPSYMSPEQAQGTHVDERTDIYSLGIMFYELLTSKNPFYDNRGYQQTIWNVLHSEIPPLRRVADWTPRDLEVIVMKSLEREQEKRYQTMRAFRMDMERFQTGEPIMARSPGFAERVARRIRKSRGVFIFSIVILTLLALFMFYYSYQMSLEKADWQNLPLKPEFYSSLDVEWKGERGPDREELKFIAMESPWMGSGNKIQVSADEYTWICWKRMLNSDIQLDFTIMLNRDQTREFGCFIHGLSPDNGYTVRFQGDGIYLTKGSRNNILDIASPKPLKKGEHMNVRVEKNDVVIRLYINGTLKISYDDYTPLTGIENNRLGFYVDNGGVILSDVKIYQLGVPLKTKPIQTAERFFERGYYRDAIDEYRNIVSLYPDNSMASRAQFKTGLAFIRLGDYGKAVTEFENILKSQENTMFPHALAQMAECYRLLGDKYRAEKTLLHIRDKFPGTSALIGILSAYNNQLVSELSRNDTLAFKSIAETIDFLSKNFTAYGRFYLPAYLRFGDAYVERGMYSEAQEVFESIDRDYSKDIEDAAMAAVRLADIEAFNGKFEKAAFKYSQVTVKNRPNSRSCAEAWMGLGLLNRALGKTEDAVKCYNYVITEYGSLRELASEAQLNCALAYLEKEIPDPVATAMFKKVASKYRDQDQHVAVARMILGEVSEAEAQRKIDKPMLDYYIGEKYRNSREYVSALVCLTKYRKNVLRNLLWLRLVDRQISFVK